MNRMESEDMASEGTERQELLAISPGFGKNDTSKNAPRIMRRSDIDTDTPSETPPMNEDEDDPITECIGIYGKWQLKMTFLLSLCSFPCTFHIFSPTFLGVATDFWCARPDNLKSVNITLWRQLSQPDDSCSMYQYDWSQVTPDSLSSVNILPKTKLIPCTSWEFDNSMVETTLISEWLLLCDREYLTTMADVLFLFGIGLGGVVSGMISDRFGRKRTLMFALVCQCLVGLSLTFCPWFALYLILRVILGFFSVGVVFSAFVIIVELVGGKWRTTCGVCNFFPLPVSYILVALLSMALPNWRHLQLAISLPGFLLISYWWIVPESPNWLLIMGRIPEVKTILSEAAKYNKRSLPPSIDKILEPDGKNTQDDQHAAGFLDLFKGPMRKVTVCVFIIWFATTIVYYGLVLNLSSFGGDLHITSILSGIVEIPAIAISIPVLLKLGRRYPISLSLIIAGLCCLAVAIVDAIVEQQALKISLMMISKFSISATNGVLPMFTAELYPTLMRNLGVGASQVSAGIALVCIPYIWTLESIAKTVPMILTGLAGLAGGLCVLMLPETSNTSLAAVNYDIDKDRQAGGNSETPVSNGPSTDSKTS